SMTDEAVTGLNLQIVEPCSFQTPDLDLATDCDRRAGAPFSPLASRRGTCKAFVDAHEIDFGIAKRCAPAGNQHVAGNSQCHAATPRRAADGGNRLLAELVLYIGQFHV